MFPICVSKSFFDKKELKLAVIDPLTYEKLQDAKKDEDDRLIWNIIE